jgi:hypothetical protein
MRDAEGLILELCSFAASSSATTASALLAMADETKDEAAVKSACSSFCVP